MAGLGDLLQRIARSLEEANARQPGDDLRARLGYGTGDDDEDDEPAEGSIREPEQESTHAAGTARTLRTPEPRWAPAPETMPSPARHRTSAPGVVPAVRRPSPGAPLHSHVPPESLLSKRIRARLRTSDALREAFVVKEILDRPLARRRRG